MSELDEIISGPKTRKLFERFLFAGNIWGTPTTTHPGDIEKLDVFICALNRYRSHVRIPALKQWLIERKKWPHEDAEWTCTRIQVGLEILRANRLF
jgi:hypothetical protein